MIDALRGRVALVTGASGGIGAAIARGVAGAGMTVAAGYGSGREPTERLVAELRAAGVHAQAFGADLADAGEAAALADRVARGLGAIDVLVANHGRATRASWDALDIEEFDRTLAVNLRAPFVLARSVLTGMQQRGFGRVLFVSSGAAFTGGIVGPHYAASKAGLHGLTHHLAARVAGRGVTVNAIAPALVDTAMLPGDRAELTQRIPVGRVGEPEEVADLALAMLRNGYLTSQVVSLDGGLYPR